DVPEAVVAEAAQPDPALFDDALAAVDALAPVEQPDPSPSALVADEITNETSVDQIEEASALEAAPAPVAAADEAPVPTETPADEISRAIDSELNPAAAKLPPPLPPPGKTLHGLPVLRLAEEAAPANLEPEKLEVPAVPEDEELGGDAIAAMLAANRG
ncbi:MAG TPA: hypothetical protein VGG33_08635, partial [Polyangia bacterium]